MLREKIKIIRTVTKVKKYEESGQQARLVDYFKV